VSMSNSVSAEEADFLLHVAMDASLGATFKERFEAVTEAVSSLVPSSSLSVFVLPKEGHPDPGHLIFRNRSADDLRGYTEGYIEFDPMAPGIQEASGVPTTLSDYVSDQAFGKDAYTGEYLPGLDLRHILAIAHRMPDGGRLALALQRESQLGDFTPHERLLLRLASPIVCRAAFGALLREKLVRLGAVAAPGATSGGMIFDSSGDVIHADPGALEIYQRMLGEAGEVVADAMLSVVQDLLSPACQEADGAKRTFPLGDSSRVAARFSVLRVQVPQVMVVLEVLKPGTRQFLEAQMDAAELTVRERQVATLAIMGEGNQGIGFRLKISPVTVAVHLGNIYRKVGVAGRGHLSLRLLGIQDALEGPGLI
jgi:DNA-binding CsgD family transcriptional regulator